MGCGRSKTAVSKEIIDPTTTNDISLIVETSAVAPEIPTGKLPKPVLEGFGKMFKKFSLTCRSDHLQFTRAQEALRKLL